MDDDLRVLSEQYRAIVQASPLPIVALDRTGFVTLWNPAAERLFGWNAEEVLGKPLPFIPEEKRDEHRRFRERDLRGENLQSVEIRRVRKDGSYLDLSVSTAALRDGAGALIGIMSLYVDMTDRKRAEAALRQANVDLTKANRELEEFAYVASHDLREPLRMVHIYTELLLKRHVNLDDKQAREYAGFIEQGVRRMEVLIQDVLSYSRTISSDPAASAEPTDLSACLAVVLETLDAQIREANAEIRYEQLPEVLADPAQMSVLLENLLSNSLKYHKRGEFPRIDIRSQIRDNDYVVSIADNGIGFDPQYANRIFGLFKRLHTTEYPGTGLGLAICKRIVERHGGQIWAESKPGHGSTFFFALPRANNGV